MHANVTCIYSGASAEAWPCGALEYIHCCTLVPLIFIRVSKISVLLFPVFIFSESSNFINSQATVLFCNAFFINYFVVLVDFDSFFTTGHTNSMKFQAT